MKKDKCGIVTFFPNYNYGCLIQSYALNKFLKNYCNCDVETIYFEPSWKYLCNKRMPVKFFLGAWRFFLRHKSLKKIIPFCEKISGQKNYTLESINKKKYDILICGSDQIWHSNCFVTNSGGYRFYFLDFAQKVKKKIAYAPSLSVNKWPDSFARKVLPLLKDFDAISVRETSSVLYLNSLGVKNVTCVCDPTLLLNAKFYKENFEIIESSEKYVFVYRIREFLFDTIQNILKNEKVKKVDLKRDDGICSVSDWLKMVCNAKFVVTDSFHCTVFCILFHKSFIVLANHDVGKGMNERFQTLLGKTDLLYRVLPQETTQKDVTDRLNRPVDWNKVDFIMDEWRSYSANWLKEALEK